MIAIEINTIFEGVCGFLMHFNNFFSVQELLKEFGKERWGFHIYIYIYIVTQSEKWFLGKYTFWVIFFLMLSREAHRERVCQTRTAATWSAISSAFFDDIVKNYNNLIFCA